MKVPKKQKVNDLSKVVYLEDYRPDFSSLVRCKWCKHEWQAVYALVDKIENLECPKCATSGETELIRE